MKYNVRIEAFQWRPANERPPDGKWEQMYVEESEVAAEDFDKIIVTPPSESDDRLRLIFEISAIPEPPKSLGRILFETIYPLASWSSQSSDYQARYERHALAVVDAFVKQQGGGE